jgi:hypothetical protein
MIDTAAQSLNLHAANFGDELTFLRKHTDVIVLHDKSSEAQVIVAPKGQTLAVTLE